MTGSLVVVPYDPSWPRRFEDVRAALVEQLGPVPYLAIEHVGSTSVPGLAAKPVLDIDVIVEREQVEPASDALAHAGYEPLGEMGVVDRWAFRAPDDGIRRNVYVTVVGSLNVRNHLGLRDVLRSDAELRDRYGAVKLAMAAVTDDIEVYIDGKTDIVLEILRRAGITDDERDELERINRL